MKLEEGMYVRTSKGKIRKFEGNNSMARVPFMIKCSYNIIDLIEEGDYVNGKYVYENGFDFSGKRCLHMRSSATYACEVFLYEEDIKDIVTKEQFESMKYEVKE